MFPLLYTREFILEKAHQKLTHDPEVMIYTDASHTLYNVRRFDSAAAPKQRGVMRFETTVQAVNPDQKILVGVLDTSALHMGPNSPGVVFSIDPETGMLTDLVNDVGVFGYLDAAPLENVRELEIVIELEFIRNICLPKITIGEESFLHPALYLPAVEIFAGVAGAALGANSTADFQRGVVVVDETVALSA